MNSIRFTAPWRIPTFDIERAWPTKTVFVSLLSASLNWSPNGSYIWNNSGRLGATSRSLVKSMGTRGLLSVSLTWSWHRRYRIQFLTWVWSNAGRFGAISDGFRRFYSAGWGKTGVDSKLVVGTRAAAEGSVHIQTVSVFAMILIFHW